MLNWILVFLLLCPLTAAAQTEKVEYIHTDALGSIVAVTDEQGNVIERREYEPYGAQLTSAVKDGPGYTGHVQDAATGLTYMQQRYYDPGIGMMLSVDPVSVDTTTAWNFCRYCYGANNPYGFTDPDGRQSREFNWENQKLGIKAPSRSEKDWMGPAIGVALTAVLAAPVAAEAGMALLTNPGAMATATDVAAGAAGVTGTAGALNNRGAQITRSSLNRVKALVRSLSTPAAREKPIGQAQVGKLERIIEKAGGNLRNDGADGVKGSSAGTPHVQTEGLGNKTDSRHIWTGSNVKLKDE